MSAVFLLLADAELESLAGALRSGRLLPPFTGVTVQRTAPPRMRLPSQTGCSNSRTTG